MHLFQKRHPVSTTFQAFLVVDVFLVVDTGSRAEINIL